MQIFTWGGQNWLSKYLENKFARGVKSSSWDEQGEVAWYSVLCMGVEICWPSVYRYAYICTVYMCIVMPQVRVKFEINITNILV